MCVHFCPRVLSLRFLRQKTRWIRCSNQFESIPSVNKVGKNLRFEVVSKIICIIGEWLGRMPFLDEKNSRRIKLFGSNIKWNFSSRYLRFLFLSFFFLSTHGIIIRVSRFLRVSILEERIYGLDGPRRHYWRMGKETRYMGRGSAKARSQTWKSTRCRQVLDRRRVNSLVRRRPSWIR